MRREPLVGSIHGSEASGHQENTDMITVSDTLLTTCELREAHTLESDHAHIVHVSDLQSQTSLWQ